MRPTAPVLAALFDSGPMTWPELCGAMGTEDTSHRSPVWEPLQHLIELGLVREAYATADNIKRYRATSWRLQQQRKRVA